MPQEQNQCHVCTHCGAGHTHTHADGCHHACCTIIENLSVQMGQDTIIHDINLHVHCGETTAIIGPNGAGKSTLIKAIIGEVKHEGTIRFVQANGTKVLSPIIGYVPQTPRFDPQYPASVLDLFVACTTDHPVWLRPSKAVRNHVELALARVGMEDQIDKKVGVLSGGQLQRVLLALALEPLPQILLLDEPSTGVDAKGLKTFYSTVEEIKQKYDLTVLIITHDRGLMEEYADRLVLLNSTIVKVGTPQEVLLSEEYKQLLG